MEVPKCSMCGQNKRLLKTTADWENPVYACVTIKMNHHNQPVYRTAEGVAIPCDGWPPAFFAQES